METQRNGAKMRYVRNGSGPPLLLLHGLLGGSFCWRLNFPVFAERFTTYAIDLPGCGDSEDPQNKKYGMEAQAAHLLAFCAEHGLKHVNVVGSSWGGGVAQLFAAANPELVRSLVLAAPVNPWSDFGRERVRFFSSGPGAALLRISMPFSRPLHLWGLKRMYGDPQKIPEGTLEGYSRAFLRKGLARNVVQMLRSWDGDLKALRAAAERIKAPVLLVWGTRDGAVDLRSAEVLKRKMPQCELAIIEGAGHLPFEETPEEFNRIVMEFLNKIGPSGDLKIG
jgi:pimeloyl-ACP methyl ester carboxylesterase